MCAQPNEAMKAFALKPGLQAMYTEAALAPAAANDLYMFSQRWVDDNANTRQRA